MIKRKESEEIRLEKADEGNGSYTRIYGVCVKNEAVEKSSKKCKNVYKKTIKQAANKTASSLERGQDVQRYHHLQKEVKMQNVIAFIRQAGGKT